MKELFVTKISPSDLHNDISVQRRRVDSVWNGLESDLAPSQ